MWKPNISKLEYNQLVRKIKNNYHDLMYCPNCGLHSAKMKGIKIMCINPGCKYSKYAKTNSTHIN